MPASPAASKPDCPQYPRLSALLEELRGLARILPPAARPETTREAAAEWNPRHLPEIRGFHLRNQENRGNS